MGYLSTGTNTCRIKNKENQKLVAQTPTELAELLNKIHRMTSLKLTTIK